MAELRRQNLKLVDEGRSPHDPSLGPGPTSEVARILRAARARAGIELRDAAQALKIQYPYLVALEEGRFGELPGPTYALGFVRAYADFLDLDGEDVVRQFKEEGQGLARRTALVFPEPIQEGRFPGAAALLIALVVAVLAYGGWYYYQSSNRIAIATIPPVPPGLIAPPPPTPPAKAETAAPSAASAATLAPEQTGPAASQPGMSAAATAASNPPVGAASAGTSVATGPGAANPGPVNPVGSNATAASQPATPPASQPSQAAAATQASPQLAALPQPPDTTGAAKHNDNHVFGEDNLDSRVLLSATQDSWVQVRDHGSNVLFTRVLHEGDSYRVPNKPGLVLYTGNVGGLDVIVDGRPAPALGTGRTTRKNVSLDPDRLLAGPVTAQ
jgi:cytoskeletal protein RodZ